MSHLSYISSYASPTLFALVPVAQAGLTYVSVIISNPKVSKAITAVATATFTSIFSSYYSGNSVLKRQAEEGKFLVDNMKERFSIMGGINMSNETDILFRLSQLQDMTKQGDHYKESISNLMGAANKHSDDLWTYSSPEMINYMRKNGLSKWNLSLTNTQESSHQLGAWLQGVPGFYNQQKQCDDSLEVFKKDKDYFQSISKQQIYDVSRIFNDSTSSHDKLENCRREKEAKSDLLNTEKQKLSDILNAENKKLNEEKTLLIKSLSDCQGDLKSSNKDTERYQKEIDAFRNKGWFG